MTTGLMKLTRRELKNFDDFGTKAVLTAMNLGGQGKIQGNGHAQIRGENGVTITISRDNSAPNCQGNVRADLKRAFPQLRTNGTTKKDKTVTSTKASKSTYETVDGMVECPAKGCNEKFATLGEANDHVHSKHYICKWEGCNWGPDGGPYVSAHSTGIGGHVGTRHKKNLVWTKNRDRAAAKRAATIAAKREAKAAKAAQPTLTIYPTVSSMDVAAESNGLRDLTQEPSLLDGIVDEHGHPAVVAPVMPELAVPVKPARHIAPPETSAEQEDALAKLALIQEVLGENPEIVKLRKENAALKAHIAFVRDAVGLDIDDDTEAGDS